MRYFNARRRNAMTEHQLNIIIGAVIVWVTWITAMVVVEINERRNR